MNDQKAAKDSYMKSILSVWNKRKEAWAKQIVVLNLTFKGFALVRRDSITHTYALEEVETLILIGPMSREDAFNWLNKNGFSQQDSKSSSWILSPDDKWILGPEKKLKLKGDSMLFVGPGSWEAIALSPIDPSEISPVEG